MAHLAGDYKLIYCSGNFLNGDCGIDAMLVEQVNHLDSKPLQ